jgi:hypothetical protein
MDDEPAEVCIVCGGAEPCSHDFGVMPWLSRDAANLRKRSMELFERGGSGDAGQALEGLAEATKIERALAIPPQVDAAYWLARLRT